MPEEFNLKDYIYRSPISRYFNGEMWLPYQSSRGCCYSCVYCSHPILFGKKVRMKSAEYTVNELNHIYLKYGIKNFNIYDENFAQNPERTKKILKMLMNSNIDFKWKCMIRADKVPFSLIDAMAMAGCKHISFGIESFDSKVLNACNKYINISQAIKAIKHTSDCGIKIRLFIMLGLPEQDIGSVHKTIQGLHKVEKFIDEIETSIIVPYPGTKLFENNDDYGIKITGNEYRTNMPRSDCYDVQFIKPKLGTNWLSADEIYKSKQLIRNTFLELDRFEQDINYIGTSTTK